MHHSLAEAEEKLSVWFNVIKHETGTHEVSAEETRKLGCLEELGKFQEPFWILLMKCHW